MKTLRKWFGVGIVVVIIAEVLINLFLFPQLPRDLQVTLAYITNVIALVLGLFVSFAVLWEVVKYVLLNPPKKG